MAYPAPARKGSLQAEPLRTGATGCRAKGGPLDGVREKESYRREPTALLPPGTIIDFAGSVTPTGFLPCDGSAVSRTTYAALYTALGGANSPWGAGDGSSTFNLPDFRGRVGVGAGTGAGLTNRVMAATGGEELHAMSVGEMASHSHTINISDPWHSHVQNAHSHSIADQAHQHAGGNHQHLVPSHGHNVSDPGHSHIYQLLQISGGFATGPGGYGYSNANTTASGKRLYSA